MNVIDYKTKYKIPEDRIEAMKARGYDIFVYHNNTPIFINSNSWSEEKNKQLYEKYGLRAFREELEDSEKRLVIYDPQYFKIFRGNSGVKYLHCMLNGGEVVLPVNCSTLGNMFRSNRAIKIDFSGCDLSNIISMSRAFVNSEQLCEVTFGKQNFTKLENVDSTFSYCMSLESTDLAEQYLPNLKVATCCFSECTFETLDISKWCAKSLDASGIVRNCRFLKSFNCDGSYLECVRYMCYNCENLERIKFGEALLDESTLVFDMCTRLHEIVGSTDDSDIIEFFKGNKDNKENPEGQKRLTTLINSFY